MKKIAVMGLVNWNNYGEQFLADTVSYLIGKDYNIKCIDFRPEKRGVRQFIYYIMVILEKFFSFWHKSYSFIVFGVKCLTKKYYLNNLEDCDAIIFACGSYKYSTQKLWAYYSIVIEIAEKLNIPVMFNAVNIQDFNSNDPRCIYLKKHTNYQCVKVFTTRDGEYGLQKFRDFYLEKNSHVFSDMVGDPAFWIPECYKNRKMDGSVKIGINVIRGKIFTDYGSNITENELVDIYCQLVRKLEKKGVEWEFFTNGLKVDYLMAKKILKKLDMENRQINVPESVEDLVKIISKYKMIIGARLHACICAYALDIPLVSFIWDEKMLRFSQITDLEALFIKQDELTADKLYQQIDIALKLEYNKKLRMFWKNKTKESIRLFLTKNLL